MPGPHVPIIVLDPGHGGSDPGAADATETVVEKVVTLQIAKRAAADLRAFGYRVYLTRTQDQDVNSAARDLNHDRTINNIDEFDARNLFANRHHANVFVSIHLDASNDPTIRGTHGYYCAARPFWQNSEQLANLITAGISRSVTQAGYDDSNNGVQSDVADIVPQARSDYPWFLVLGPSRRHFVTGTAMPGALIETMYLSSPKDAQAVRQSKILDAIGHGYANGIRAYLLAQSTH